MEVAEDVNVKTKNNLTPADLPSDSNESKPPNSPGNPVAKRVKP